MTLGIESGISVSVPFLTGIGTTTLLSITPSMVLLLSGIGIAMHSVASYAHTYMGYECYDRVEHMIQVTIHHQGSYILRVGSMVWLCR